MYIADCRAGGNSGENLQWGSVVWKEKQKCEIKLRQLICLCTYCEEYGLFAICDGY